MSRTRPTIRPRSSTPEASTPQVRRRMQATPQRDTAPEVALRSAIHRLKFRFRVDWTLPNTRRRADLAFVAPKVAVFVDGCFWHCCPQHATWPKNNADWWRKKLTANVARDRDTDRRLEAAGWAVVRVWEHEHIDHAVRKLTRVLRRRSGTRESPRPTGKDGARA
jgi:DNA mismatch endonuclease, patch repair protein